MRIVVAGIPAAGQVVDVSLEQEWAVEAATLALDGRPTALDGQLRLEVASDHGVVKVSGQVHAGRPAVCDRCGEPCVRDAQVELSLLYAPEAKDEDTFDGSEIELTADELDLGWYEGGALQLGMVLGEALALGLPARIRCAEVGECDKRTDALLANAQAGEPGHPAHAALAALRDQFS